MSEISTMRVMLGFGWMVALAGIGFYLDTVKKVICPPFYYFLGGGSILGFVYITQIF